MVDTISEERRSWNMSRIKGKNTKPEIIVRSLLHKAGYRFRIHRKDLPGKPDIVLPKHNMVIFVHGCYWHRHQGCRFTYTPKSRTDFWNKKFSDTVERDIKHRRQLIDMGWKVEVIWECETESLNELNGKINKILSN
ncbi:MAG: DNA mismatch endonuclease Vsr [Desulfosalsimonadaceae bacterium]